MVYAFLVHTATPGVCRMFYSQVFAVDEILEEEEEDYDRRRLLRKERLAAVARQVQTACVLAAEADYRLNVEAQQPLAGFDESRTLVAIAEAETGALRLPPGDLFSQELAALWLAPSKLALTLLCEEHDNLTVAEMVLRRMAAALLTAPRPDMDLLMRPERVDLLLDTMMPCGQLLFLNHQLMRNLEKELMDA
uniref:Adaptor related protein complex 5 subunit sigma 1 n=1 Tax=Eptatretus burgeri TaxID=7764 RepID=A0A8C4Q1E7_EPTBU